MSDHTLAKVEVVLGLLAGFANTLVTHPLDLVKVRLQLTNSASTKPFELLRLVIKDIQKDAATAYSKQAGPKQSSYAYHLVQQCYRGVGPNLVGNVAAWGLYFTLYADFKRRMSTDGSTNYFAASALAGISTSVLTNPIWLLKTRILSTSNQQEHSYRSLSSGVKEILQKEGIRTFWKGTVPSLFQVFQASLQFTLYDHTKNWLEKRNTTNELLSVQFIYASVFSKTVSMSLLYPSQVVRSRLQSYNLDHEQRTLASVTRVIWTNEGLRGFYRGLGANVLRVMPSTCITFLTYETTKKYLSTGNNID